ncbi:ABC transporter permease [bacterium]|nr:ABC transporter permease [bacterium]
MIKNLINNKDLILILVKRDFEGRYKNSVLYFVWPFLHPFLLTLTLWFVFTCGFKNGNSVNGIPFILWLITGLIPWYFFSESISKGVISIKEYAYIIKNMPFPIEILPVIKTLSSLITHSFFLLVLFLILLFYHLNNFIFFIPNLIYFIFCSMILSTSINYFTSSIFVIFKDTAEILKILVNFTFWLTPIIWNGNLLTGKLKMLLYLNPVYYIINGYRDTLLYSKPFWNDLKGISSFWIITLILIYVSSKIFNKLKSGFADML